MWGGSVYYNIIKKKKNKNYLLKYNNTLKKNIGLYFIKSPHSELIKSLISFSLSKILKTIYYYIDNLNLNRKNLFSKSRFYIKKLKKRLRYKIYLSRNIDYMNFFLKYNKRIIRRRIKRFTKFFKKWQRRFASKIIYRPLNKKKFSIIYKYGYGLKRLRRLKQANLSFHLYLHRKKLKLISNIMGRTQCVFKRVKCIANSKSFRALFFLKKRLRSYVNIFKKKFFKYIIGKGLAAGKFDISWRCKKYKKYRLKKLITRVDLKFDIKDNVLMSNRPAYYHLMYLYSFCKFRYSEFSILVRYKYAYSYFMRVLRDIDSLLRPIRFPKFYIDGLIRYFAIMCFTREVNRFSVYIKGLLEKLGRIGQKNFFHTFNGVSVDTLLTVLNKHQIVGFYLRVSGKIGGYVGDRTKLFLIRYGKCSRSKRVYGYSYYQNVAFTKPGAIGINVMLSFK